MFSEEEQEEMRAWGVCGAASSPARDRCTVKPQLLGPYAQQRCHRALSTSAKSAASPTATDACDDEDDDLDRDAVEYVYRYVRVRRQSSRGAEVSGLPLVCSNCGVSFFSLRSNEDELDCYCSGECKWSVIMYREMDRRMISLRSGRAPTSYMSSYGQESEYYGSSSCQYVDEVISCR